MPSSWWATSAAFLVGVTTRCTPLSVGGVDGDGEHGRLPAACCAFHDHERVGGGDRSSRALLGRIQPTRPRQRVHVRRALSDSNGADDAL